MQTEEIAIVFIVAIACVLLFTNAIPFTESQFYAQVTDINYDSLLAGDYNNKLAIYKGSKLSTADINDLNIVLPDITNLIPYTGANKNVDLGDQNITATSFFGDGSNLTGIEFTDTNIFTAGIMSKDNNSFLIDLTLENGNIILTDSDEGDKLSTIYAYNEGEHRYTGIEFHHSGDAEKIFFRIGSDHYPLRLYSPADNTYGMEVEAEQVLFNVRKTTFDGNIYADGYIHADGYITNSVVADMSKTSALSKLDNINEWVTSKGDIDYSKHYAGTSYKVKEIIGYENKPVTNAFCEGMKDEKGKDIILIDGTQDTNCYDKTEIIKTPIYKEVTEQGLDLEVRVAEMEKMIWELKNALCKTDPKHDFCK